LSSEKRSASKYGSDDESISSLIDQLGATFKRSMHSKKDVTSEKIDHLLDELHEEKDKHCMDKYGNCKALIPKTNCVAKRNQMLQLCPRTCGFCDVPSIPACAKTAYGCCWDLRTTKETRNGDNCPRCLDQFQRLCNTFKDDCEHMGGPGDFMRLRCPETCQVCEQSCQDSGSKGLFCDLWSHLNWCKTKENVMRYHCSKACGFC